MTIEFWPRSLRTPKPEKRKTAKKPRKRRPKLPIKVGKAHQMLTTAIILGDHELAAWIYKAAMDNMVTGKPRDVREFQKRLDSVMA